MSNGEVLVEVSIKLIEDILKNLEEALWTTKLQLNSSGKLEN